MRHRLVPVMVVVLLLLLALAAAAQPRVEADVPEPLRPWQAWVLDAVPEHACPVRDEIALCEWPGRIVLQLDASGGRFEQIVRVDSERFFQLPGAGGRWPFDVRVDGKPAAVVDRGVPSLELAPGEHRLEGRFEWAALPERLELSPRTALVDLRIAGQPVAFPRRDESGQLWLLGGDEADAEGEQLSLFVTRKIEDGIPMRVTTRIKLRVAGRAREVNLGRVLLPGTRPLSLSSELPARLEEQGDLRLQVRAGTYQVEVLARSQGPLETLTMKRAGAAWPETEVWVWQADESLRQVELSGAPAVDPGRTELAEDWHGLPTYLLREGTSLKLETTRRGEASPPPNRLELRRELWLDLDGRGYTVRDTLQAELHQGYRLDLLQGELGHVAVDGDDMLITHSPDGKHAGVELRKQNQSLVAEWRAPDRLSSLPAVGWSEDVQSLGATLNLGPGYSVLGARGVDSLSQSWFGDWDLFALFFVLLCSIAVARLCGNRYLALALVTLVLCQQEPDAPGVVWVVLLATIALLRVLPAGWFRNLVRLVYVATVIGLLLVAVPFAADQIRAALYPQLSEQGGYFDLAVVGGARKPAPEPSMVQEEALEEDFAEAKSAPARGGALMDELGSAPASPSSEESAPLKRLGARSRAYQQDPEATLQTGPGVPNWRWRSWQLEWSGPVDRQHEIQLYLISPAVNRVLSVLRALLLGLLVVVLLASATAGRDKPGAPQPPAAEAAALSGLVGALVAAVLGCVLSPSLARADIPDKQALDELRARLTEPAPCQPSCASIDGLDLAVDARELSLTLTVHALADTSVALPGPASSWVPRSATLDGRPNAPLRLSDDGFLHVRVSPGVSVIVVRGPVPPSDTLTLAVLDRPHRAHVRADGFKVDGVREDGQVEQALQLSRMLADEEAGKLETAALPPWFSLTRRFVLGPTWVVENRLERISPSGTPVRVQVPLLPGESVTDSAIEVGDGQLNVSFGRDDMVIEWTSRLSTRDVLKLVAVEGRPFSERWHVACGPIWHCTSEGLAPVGRGSGELYEPEFAPWPGETLSLAVTRPEPAPGQSVTIDSAALEVTPGVRMRKAELNLQVRTSRGTSETIELPEGARVQAQTIDGQARPIRHEGSRLHFTLGPGSHGVQLQWQEPQGVEVVERVRSVGLHRPASNASLVVYLPDDRWLLWASGPAWGPAVLFWGYLVFVLLIALALGRVKHSPLRFGEWLLLGIGLTQVPAPAALAVVAWFFALAARSRMQEQPRLLHNLIQLLLAGFSLVALGCLYAAVHSGLLMDPDMQVAGAGSSDRLLRFYVDHVAGKLPTASVVSLPMWVFRLVMLVWSLWLAWSLVRWLPWAFSCFKEGGLWRRRPPKRTTQPAPPPAQPPPAAPPQPPPAQNPPAGS